jgi:hypothetical protein
MDEDAGNITSSAANRVIMIIISDSKIQSFNLEGTISSIGVGVGGNFPISDVA